MLAVGFILVGVLSDGNAGNFDSLVGTKIYIKADNFANFANALRRNLTNYNTIVVNDEKSSDYIINIQDVKRVSINKYCWWCIK